MSATIGRLRDPQQRAERAMRVLDVTADLLHRHGYRRVTIDDVAAGAGIGKGTIYLHWKNREQLFGAVFEREVLRAMDELRQALRQEPKVCLLHRFAQTYFLAIVNRPLLHGFLLEDPDLLGKLAASADAARDDRHGTMARQYVGLLAEHGLLRDDMTVDEIGYAYQATFEGFLRAEDSPGAGGPDTRAHLLAKIVRRAFESEPEPSVTTLRDVATATATLLDDLIDADRSTPGAPSP
ncbi:TetR/AcrR family transcriptional regulator [Promicromonospora sp. NPDC057138]|uniref:TetR/AcrR family transcriptional regulator n=1 Tax=Promicromonospora sp. NPDC057138 TaxID=3346031 RepID=UPI003642D6BA